MAFGRYCDGLEYCKETLIRGFECNGDISPTITVSASTGLPSGGYPFIFISGKAKNQEWSVLEHDFRTFLLRPEYRRF